MFPQYKSIVLFEKRDLVYVEPFKIPVPTTFLLLEAVPRTVNTLEGTSRYLYKLEGEVSREFELE